MSSETFDEIVEFENFTIDTNSYEKGNEIGSGGFSKVYEVKKYRGCAQQFLGEVVILKQLFSAQEIKTVSNFYHNEVRALKMLNGQYSKRFPQCLSYWGANESKKYFIVLERCSYGSLSDLMKYLRDKRQPLNELQIIFILREILLGVEIMHSLKMIHRDLKLENIMIDHNFRVKLIDFGLAKVGENGEDPFDDRHNGSLYYLAPEMLEEKGRYSYEVDVWSIGIILYYLLFLKFPYMGENKEKMLNAINKNTVIFSAKESSYESLIALTKNLLQRDKAKRTKSVRDLLKHPIFDKLIGNEDIASILQEKNREHFELKSKSLSIWKKQVEHEFRFNFATQIEGNPQMKAKAQRFALKRSIKTRKVKIIHLIHNKNYGFFMLLSNLTLLAYFNNCKTIEFSLKLIDAQVKTNEEAIFCYIYQKHFAERMKNMADFDGRVQENEPQCRIKNLLLINNNLFVRLTNDVLQIFFEEVPVSQAQDGSMKYQLSFQYNMNTQKPNQIIVVNPSRKRSELQLQQQSQTKVYSELQQGQIAYKDFQEAASSPHSKYINYTRRVIQVMLDNSSLSFGKLHLQRI